MRLAPLLLLAATGVGNDTITMESLLAELRSENPDVSSKASSGILSGWMRWKDQEGF